MKKSFIISGPGRALGLDIFLKASENNQEIS